MLDKSKHIQLASVCNIGNGFAFKSTEFKSEGIPLLRISNIDNERVSFDKKSVYVDKAYLATHGKFIVKKGDVVIALSGATTGKYGIYELNEPALLNQRIGIIKQEESEALHSKYFYFYLNQLKAEILRKAQGAAQPNISTKELGQIELPVPPLKEQKQIAEILDAADSLRQKDKQLVEHYDHLSQSLFLDMFGVPNHNVHNFEVGTIRDLVSTVNYGTSAKAQAEGEYPYLRMNNITYQGYMNYESLKYIDLSEKDQEKYLAKKGDILFNRTNSKELVGKTGLFDEDEAMALAGYLIRVRTNEKANPYYIWRFMNSVYCKTVLNHMCKSIVGMANINAQELQNIKVLIPPVELQDQFKIRVKEIEKQKYLAQQALKKSDELFNSLLQKAFKGELTAN